MRINRIKKKMKNGEPVFGIMIKEARNINIAEILEIAGFDYFVIDMEHAYLRHVRYHRNPPVRKKDRNHERRADPPPRLRLCRQDA